MTSLLRSLCAGCLALFAAACATPPAAPEGQAAGPAVNAVPANWDPIFFDRAMREAQQARSHGDRVTAERACARGILHAQAQVIRVLQAYAETLDRERPGSGVPVRAKVQKLEQARDEQAAQRKGGTTYLGFDPALELKAYADLLAGMNRKNDALVVEALSSAYSYSQGANLRRSQLQREGKDPLGEC